MSQGTLHWDDWYRSDGCRYHMDRNSFAGVAFTSIFYDAMRSIEAEIPAGRVYAEAAKIVNLGASPSLPVPFNFDPADADRLLRQGRFNLPKRIPVGGTWLSLRLRFEGPDLPEDADSWGSAPIGMPHVNVNFYKLMDVANTRYGQTADGLRRLVVLTGGLVLHEVMHTEGFDHPDSVTHAQYNETLPEVAGQAFVNIFYPGMAFLVGDENPHFRCTRSIGSVPESLTANRPLFESELAFLNQQGTKRFEHGKSDPA